MKILSVGFLDAFGRPLCNDCWPDVPRFDTAFCSHILPTQRNCFLPEVFTSRMQRKFQWFPGAPIERRNHRSSFSFCNTLYACFYMDWRTEYGCFINLLLKYLLLKLIKCKYMFYVTLLKLHYFCINIISNEIFFHTSSKSR